MGNENVCAAVETLHCKVCTARSATLQGLHCKVSKPQRSFLKNVVNSFTIKEEVI